MEIFTSAPSLKSFLSNIDKGLSIGFIPTMGALHKGHLSLIEKSKKNCDITVCSIYVNPTQFNQDQDLNNYPRTLEKDIELLKSVSCSICFTPTNEEIYPNGTDKLLKIDLNGLDHFMEGEHRPGHFTGVITVVNNLFNIVNPTVAYFGEKDFQQLAVIRAMVKKLKLNISIEGYPIVRESDGLAMSSRNLRLSQKERTAAPFIYKTLSKVSSMNEPIKKRKTWIHEQFENHPLFSLDYFDIANENDLTPTNSTKNARAFIAAYIGNVRLIDNMPLIN